MNVAARKIAEGTAFLGLALALHIGILWARSDGNGQLAGGSGGEASVSMAGASAAMSEMIAEWDKAPTATDSPDAVTAEAQDAPPAPAPPAASPPPRLTPPPQSPAPAVTTPPQAELATPEAPRAGLAPSRNATPDAKEPVTPPEPLPVVQETPVPEQPPEAETAPVEPPEIAEETEVPETAPLPRAKPKPPQKPRPAVAAASPASPPKQPKPAKPAPARAAATGGSANDGSAPAQAAGTGGGAEEGTGSAPETAGLSNSQKAELAQIWGSRIRSDVERKKRKPRNQRRFGTTMIALTVKRDGALISARIQESAGSADLDQAAMSAVNAAAPYPPAPAELTGGSFQFVLPIVFRR